MNFLFFLKCDRLYAVFISGEKKTKITPMMSVKFKVLAVFFFAQFNMNLAVETMDAADLLDFSPVLRSEIHV